MHVKIDESVNNYVNAMGNKENNKQEYILKYSQSADGSVVISAEKGKLPALFRKAENNLDSIYSFIMTAGATIESSLEEPAKFAQILAAKAVKYTDNRDSIFSSTPEKTSVQTRIAKVAVDITDKLTSPPSPPQ